MAPRFEIPVGLRKGHKTTKISAGRKGLTDKTIQIRPSRLKGLQTKHSKFVRDLVDKSYTNLVSNKKAISEQKASKKIKPKNTNKGKNLNEKILQRKFKKAEDIQNVEQRKVVDPFFITATGENYMSVSEPRPPDEFKEAHRQGNRKLRRAIMFGYEPKTKPRRDNFMPNRKFEQNNDFSRVKSGFNDRANYRSNENEKRLPKNKVEEPKLEKLHPSWEAKKKLSSIVPFQGKKIVFDDS